MSTGKQLLRMVAKDMADEVLKAVYQAYVDLRNPASQGVDTEDPYLELGIRPDAEEAVVKAAYRALARKYHPDTGKAPDAKRFGRVKRAYDAIMSS